MSMYFKHIKKWRIKGIIFLIIMFIMSFLCIADINGDLSLISLQVWFHSFSQVFSENIILSIVCAIVALAIIAYIYIYVFTLGGMLLGLALRFSYYVFRKVSLELSGGYYSRIDEAYESIVKNSVGEGEADIKEIFTGIGMGIILCWPLLYVFYKIGSAIVHFVLFH